MPRLSRHAHSRGATVQARPTAPTAETADTANVTAPDVPAQPTIMSLDEAAAAYEGEWALMRVTRHDEQTGEIYGEILIHHPSRKEISKAVRRASQLEPHGELAVILGGTQRRTLEEFNALLDKGARGPYVNAHW